MPQFATIGIITKRDDDRIAPTLRAICDQLDQAGRELLLDASLDTIDGAPAGPRVDRDDLIRRAGLVVVLGGDGTLLDAGRGLGPTSTPMLGIHHGRLGFLADVRPADVSSALAGILAGDYWIEERLTLSASIQREVHEVGPYPAINDVVVRNQEAVRMLEFETWHGDEFISVHRADGIIVCTPTGSTAYALSSGGPVVHPSLHAIGLIPICPHTLSDRPLVVGADRPVRVVMTGSNIDRAMMTCDGQVNEALMVGESLTIEPQTDRLRLVHPNSYQYFHMLRDKLSWGRSKP